MGQVGVAGFQRCSQTLTGIAPVTAELAVGEQLAESPDVVVLEGQTVTFQTELETNQARFELHQQSKPLESFLADLYPRDKMFQVHRPVSDRASSMVHGLSLRSRSLLSRSWIASMKCWTANLS